MAAVIHTDITAPAAPPFRSVVGLDWREGTGVVGGLGVSKGAKDMFKCIIE